jgi:shikimate dehydrogenase
MPTCLCLIASSADEVRRQVRETDVSDLRELRVDALAEESWQQLPALCATLQDKPLLLTLRSATHGGHCWLDSCKRLQVLRQLAALAPAFLDLEWPHDLAVLPDLERSSVTPVISWHGQQIPKELESDLVRLGGISSAIWKIAPDCPTAERWIQGKQWWLEHRHLVPQMIFQPQGPLGVIQRIWSKEWLQPWTFVTAGPPTEGQISNKDWQDVYRMPQSAEPEALELYGVVGDPVAQSRGPAFHNRWMQQLSWPGRYVPLKCSAEDWPILWPWLRARASGLAITTPLKGIVGRYVDALDELSQVSGQVNTLVNQNGRWIGMNTDGPAAVACMGGAPAIAEQLVVVIGSGGVGLAVALACAQAGAAVVILCRQPNRVPSLHPTIQVDSIDHWSQWAPRCRWVVQATTCGFLDEKMPVDPERLNQQNVMEFVQRNTPFARAAKARECRVVEGVEIFVHLSMMQASLWSARATTSVWPSTAQLWQENRCRL